MNTTVLALQEEQVLAAVGRPGAKPSVQALYRAPAHGGGMENWERAVGALWQAHDLPTRGITLVLPDEAVTTHTVTAPRMPESRLEELVQHEMRAHDGQPVAADYLPLGTDADGRQQLFCAACRKETMAGYLAMADRLGLRLGSVTVPMAGRLRLLRAMPSLQTMTFICLCFEGSSVLSLLVENGAYRLRHDAVPHDGTPGEPADRCILRRLPGRRLRGLSRGHPGTWPAGEPSAGMPGIPHPAERREAERLARLRRGADSMRRDRA